jgi:hypothetical protein
MRKELTVGALALALAVGLVGTATAQDSQDSDVTVDIAQDIAIDVRPSLLQYTASGTGDALAPGEKRRVSDNDYEHIELENIGSETLDNIYVEATTAVNNSFGNQSANDHNTGNFVTLSTETVDAGSYDVVVNSLTDHHYVNRVEFFEDNPPTYIQTEPSDGEVTVDSVTISNPESRVGRFRVGGAEYFFVLYSDDFDSGSDYVVRIGRNPHTPNQIGTTDFREASTGNVYESDISSTNPGGNAYFDGSVDLVAFNESNYDGGALIDSSGQAAPVEGSTAGNISDQNTVDDVEVREYGFYYDVGNEYVLRTAANVAPESTDGGSSWDLTDESTKSGINYIVNAGNTESDALVPGQNFPLDIGVEVPLGVDKDRISQGTITIRASEWTAP